LLPGRLALRRRLGGRLRRLLRGGLLSPLRRLLLLALLLVLALLGLPRLLDRLRLVDELELGLADLDHVLVVEDLLVLPLAVDLGAVAGSQVAHQHAALAL